MNGAVEVRPWTLVVVAVAVLSTGRTVLMGRRKTDLQCVPGEACGRTAENAACTDTGQRNLRPRIAYWAQAPVPLATRPVAGPTRPVDPQWSGVRVGQAVLPGGVEQA